jgi:hypothetical protein
MIFYVKKIKKNISVLIFKAHVNKLDCLLIYNLANHVCMVLIQKDSTWNTGFQPVGSDDVLCNMQRRRKNSYNIKMAVFWDVAPCGLAEVY